VQHSLDSIKGLQLKRGFTSEVRKRVGGRKGCIHLTTLLLAMAPAALQGYWAQHDRKPEKRRVSEEMLEHYLIDPCRVWRREGPLVDHIAATAGIDLPHRRNPSRNHQ
jgi:hypothetical protein